MPDWSHLPGKGCLPAATLIVLLSLASPGVRAAPGPAPAGTRAPTVEEFLNSIGVNTHVDQGYKPDSYVEPLKFTGIRQVRDGSRNVASDILIHDKTGVRFAITGGGDLEGLLASGRALAKVGALLALEGPNEPNNFPMTFKGLKGGGRDRSWFAVADFQRSLYQVAKSDPALRHTPIFSPSETGAETDDVGLQFLVIPSGHTGPLPDHTQFADFANVHNYVAGNGRDYGDNQAWNAADPTLNARWDGLYSNFGLTWLRHYHGYTAEQLKTIPRVCTETGWDTVSDAGGQRTQGTILVNTYLAQFKRGWRYSFIYELRDGEGGTGNQGLYAGATPKLSAVYIHNLTTILASRSELAAPGGRLSGGRLAYAIQNRSETVHDLLLRKSSGIFDLIVWDERVRGSDKVTVQIRTPARSSKVYDITVGAVALRTLRQPHSVNLELSDHALVLEIVTL